MVLLGLRRRSGAPRPRAWVLIVMLGIGLLWRAAGARHGLLGYLAISGLAVLAVVALLLVREARPGRRSR